VLKLKKYLIVTFVFLIVSSASSQTLNQVHFGYIKWNKSKVTARLEMELLPSVSKKDPGKLYELFQDLFLERDPSKPVSEVYKWPNMKDRRNPRTQLKETKLTEKLFKKLATEKIGDVYTLVCPNGVWKAKVTGGTIAIDKQFDDLFRVYFDLGIDNFSPPVEKAKKSSMEIVGLSGEHKVDGLKIYEPASLEHDQQANLIKLLRTKIKKGFSEHYFVYFRNGQDLMIVANNVAAKESNRKFKGEFEEVAKFLSAVYLFRDNQLFDIFPAKVAPDNEIDTPCSYKALYRFEAEGQEYECVEEDGEACCTGGPYSSYHIFQFDPKTSAFTEIGKSRDYPLCMELFL
jgi:hypothetical protein